MAKWTAGDGSGHTVRVTVKPAEGFARGFYPALSDEVTGEYIGNGRVVPTSRGALLTGKRRVREWWPKARVVVAP